MGSARTAKRYILVLAGRKSAGTRPQARNVQLQQGAQRSQPHRDLRCIIQMNFCNRDRNIRRLYANVVGTGCRI